MPNLKEKFDALWGKVVENKEIAIRAGAALAGAILGSVVTAIAINSLSEYEDVDLLDEEDDTYGETDADQ